MTEVVRFLDHVSRLVDWKVESIVVVPNTGSHLRIQFSRASQTSGDQTPLPSSMTGPDLLVFCAWRIDDGVSVLGGGWDENSLDSPKFRALAHLRGKCVIAVDVDEPGFDLSISFDGGFRLRVFCDMVNEVDDEPNYLLTGDFGLWSVGCKSRLRWQPRPRRS